MCPVHLTGIIFLEAPVEDLKTSTRVLLVSAVALLVILLTGPLGYKFSLVPLQPSLLSVMIALVGGLLVAIVGVVYLVLAIRRNLDRDRNILILALVLGLVPAVIMVPQIVTASALPPIHDITTDTVNPPAFDAILARRANALNKPEYGSGDNWPPEKLAAAQKEAYPNVQPLVSALSVNDAVARSEEVLSDMGLEIIAVDDARGLVEGTATTFWFGFKDDVVVRVVSEGEGSRVDVRSKSRVGQGDLGANAARITEFLESF